jgi:hypothetical protein
VTLALGMMLYSEYHVKELEAQKSAKLGVACGW